MKTVAVLIFFALTLPFGAHAAPTPSPTTAPFVSTEDGGDSFVGNPNQAAADAFDNTRQKIQELTDKGETLGCGQAGEFGGSMATALDNALKNVLSQLLGKVGNAVSGKVNELLGSIAGKAGPLAPLVNIVQSKIQEKIQQTLSGLGDKILGSFGGDVTDTVGDVAKTLGIDASAIIAGVDIPGIAGVVGGGVGSVPVNEIGAQLEQIKIVRGLSEKIEVHTDSLKKIQGTMAYVTCVANPAIAKARNALLAEQTKKNINNFTTGHNGGPMFVQDLMADVVTGTRIATKEIIENQTAGMCAETKQVVQKIVLAQYQYDDDFGKRSQCDTSPSAQAARANKVPPVSAWFENRFNLKNDTMYQVLNTVSHIAAVNTDIAAKSTIEYVKNEGWYNKTECTDDNQPPPQGFCLNGEKISIPGAITAAQAAYTFTVPTEQLVQADEIGELIDTFSQGLLDFALQNVDGLLGLVEDDGGGSYLDQMVNETYDSSNDNLQGTLLSDLEGAYTVESAYYDLVDVILSDLTTARNTYTEVTACYAKYTASGATGFTAVLAQETVALASTTILTALAPQIRDLQVLKNDSSVSLDELVSLIERAESALTTEELVSISNDYSALKASGVLHNATDLEYLETGAEASVPTIELLLKDGQIKLDVCKAG